ncbi:hypothetical protein GN244_ATG14397 [Phytophthora infestans]|uniref:Uncharacterized protein n=1 Tax=Phytophthora infestans TaxID=4787 RepID=A0A833SN84_PHYIN|nr:hypothetical protein GN244_ATG14397 [Phytophthora infestans]
MKRFGVPDLGYWFPHIRLRKVAILVLKKQIIAPALRKSGFGLNTVSECSKDDFHRYESYVKDTIDLSRVCIILRNMAIGDPVPGGWIDPELVDDDEEGEDPLIYSGTAGVDRCA